MKLICDCGNTGRFSVNNEYEEVDEEYYWPLPTNLLPDNFTFDSLDVSSDRSRILIKCKECRKEITILVL